MYVIKRTFQNFLTVEFFQKLSFITFYLEKDTKISTQSYALKNRHDFQHSCQNETNLEFILKHLEILFERILMCTFLF